MIVLFQRRNSCEVFSWLIVSLKQYFKTETTMIKADMIEKFSWMENLNQVILAELNEINLTFMVVHNSII